MTEPVAFKTVADVQYFFGELSLGPWARVTAAEALENGRATSAFCAGALRAVFHDDEETLVQWLGSDEALAEGVLQAMNLLWSTRGF